ncbi:MAG: hypothetical protein ACKVKT_00250 [Rhodospirillales bacterium]|jgi:hypothetical protein
MFKFGLLTAAAIGATAFMAATAASAHNYMTKLCAPALPQYPWQWAQDDMKLTGVTPIDQTAKAK